eukprot:EG_transcript_56283
MHKKARPTAPQKRGASPAPAPSPAATVALPGCPPPLPSSSAFDSDWPRLPSPIQPPSASDPSLASGGQPVPRNAPNLAAAPPPDPGRAVGSSPSVAVRARGAVEMAEHAG